jgi:hypothetical protein
MEMMLLFIKIVFCCVQISMTENLPVIMSFFYAWLPRIRCHDEMLLIEPVKVFAILIGIEFISYLKQLDNILYIFIRNTIANLHLDLIRILRIQHLY